LKILKHKGGKIMGKVTAGKEKTGKTEEKRVGKRRKFRITNRGFCIAMCGVGTFCTVAVSIMIWFVLAGSENRALAAYEDYPAHLAVAFDIEYVSMWMSMSVSDITAGDLFTSYSGISYYGVSSGKLYIYFLVSGSLPLTCEFLLLPIWTSWGAEYGTASKADADIEENGNGTRISVTTVGQSHIYGSWNISVDESTAPFYTSSFHDIYIGIDKAEQFTVTAHISR
jgi:hypothetical protein